MRLFTILLLIVSSLAAQSTPAAAPKRAAPAKRAAPRVKAHPQIEALDCALCHAEIAGTWKASKHGVAMVKCIGCHGFPNENFTAKPAATTCRTCHPEQFSTARQHCQSCHPAHQWRQHSTKGARQ